MKMMGRYYHIKTLILKFLKDFVLDKNHENNFKIGLRKQVSVKAK